jgi:hypothetical protein
MHQYIFRYANYRVYLACSSRPRWGCMQCEWSASENSAKALA